MTVLTEPNSLGDALKWEQENDYSRKKITVAHVKALAALAVVGKITKSTPTTGTAGTNTGTGVCNSVTAGAKAKLGTYTLTCTAAATNAGTFSVKDPDGELLPPATVAVAYTNTQINFTLTDATDFVVGDSFTIVVAAGSGEYVELAPAAVDGSQVAAGFLIDAVDASAAAKEGVIIERDALVAMDNLVWPSGISAGDKLVAIAQLEDIGIKAVALA